VFWPNAIQFIEITRERWTVLTLEGDQSSAMPKFTDSPLEEEEFEPSIPRKIGDAFETALFASAAPLVPPERPTRSREGLAVRNPLSSTGESVARGTSAPSGENPASQRLVEILRGIWTPDIVTAF